MQKLVKKLNISNQNLKKTDFVKNKFNKKFSEKQHNKYKFHFNQYLKTLKGGSKTKFKRYKVFSSKFFSRLSITISPNNIFCSYRFNKSKKTLKSISSGSLKVKITSKRLKFNIKKILNLFFKSIKYGKVQYSHFLFVNIVSSIKLRKEIVKSIISRFVKRSFKKKKVIFFNIPSMKSFNGCRAKKKQRRKRKKYRFGHLK